MLLIYLPSISNRHRFIFEFLFKEVIPVDFELTESRDHFDAHNGPKFVYADVDDFVGELFFQAHGILEENEIKEQTIIVGKTGGYPSFFEVNNSALPFDIFAASFYLVSRYEEYLSFSADSHKRFEASQSLAFRNGFLNLPIIDIWAAALRNLLVNQSPSIQFRQKKYQFQTTLDIDNAYAYLHKGILRSIGAMAVMGLKLNITGVKDRLLVYSGIRHDPFDTYDIQHQLHTKYKLEPIYFFLLGDYGPFDKNLDHNNSALIKLIKSIAANNAVGIHPSYGSNTKDGQLKVEISRLENISGKKIHHSRQHYLKMQIPKTYRNLIKAGIKEDFTMGFASQFGFRAGTCSPFYFYDLEREEITGLKIHPFVIMDTTCLHLNLTPDQALKQVKIMIESIKEVNGYCCILFHNESIGGNGEWRGWSNFYEEVIKLGVE